MPTPEQILAGLTAIANDWAVAAMAWHAVLAAALIAVALGWRPSSRTVALLIPALPASVAGFAFAYGNPFNGLVFAVTTIALVALALRDHRGVVREAPAWMFWSGAAVVAYGWAYPHFLDRGPVAYLYAAPVGLVPCPTLSVAIGLALLAAAPAPARGG